MADRELYQRLLDSIEEHNGGQSWNQWRKDHRETVIDLDGVPLVQMDLRGIDLSGANLVQADLRKASLVGADLSEANLELAELSRANLTDCNLSGANLVQADLFQCLFTGTRFHNTNVEKANFEMAVLAGANVEGIRNFTIGQTCKCRTIENITGLSVPFLRQIQSERAFLMDWWEEPTSSEDPFEV